MDRVKVAVPGMLQARVPVPRCPQQQQNGCQGSARSLAVAQAALRALRWDKEAAGAGKCRSAEQQQEGQHNDLHLHDTAFNPFLYSSIGASAAPLLILNIV